MSFNNRLCVFVNLFIHNSCPKRHNFRALISHSHKDWCISNRFYTFMCMDFMSQYFSYILRDSVFSCWPIVSLDALLNNNLFMILIMHNSKRYIVCKQTYRRHFVSIPYDFRHHRIYWDLISYLRFVWNLHV